MKNKYYEMTVPVYIKMLSNLAHLLTKGAEYAIEKGVSEETLLNEKLAPDMFPLVKQIQISTDQAKGCVARLAGVEIPVMEDIETTVAELQGPPCRLPLAQPSLGRGSTSGRLVRRRIDRGRGRVRRRLGGSHRRVGGRTGCPQNPLPLSARRNRTRVVAGGRRQRVPDVGAGGGTAC